MLVYLMVDSVATIVCVKAFGEYMIVNGCGPADKIVYLFIFLVDWVGGVDEMAGWMKCPRSKVIPATCVLECLSCYSCGNLRLTVTVHAAGRDISCPFLPPSFFSPSLPPSFKCGVLQ